MSSSTVPYVREITLLTVHAVPLFQGLSRSFPALWYIQYSSIGESKNLQKVFVWLKLFPPKFSHGTKFPCTSARRQILYSSELWLQAWPVKAGVALCDLKIFFQLYSYLFVINSISISRIYAFFIYFNMSLCMCLCSFYFAF